MLRLARDIIMVKGEKVNHQSSLELHMIDYQSPNQRQRQITELLLRFKSKSVNQIKALTWPLCYKMNWYIRHPTCNGLLQGSMSIRQAARFVTYNRVGSQ